ncbi:MAG TPA: fluoride efflux transporter CrcB [Streptosporangiaceae bacterium]
MTILLVFAGGAIGAPARYVLDRLVQRHVRAAFPWGTLTVNLVGSAILGALLGAGVSHQATLFAGTGVCGAFTTFSTFGYETVRLLEDGSVPAAALNALGSLALGLLTGAAAYAIAATLV